ncbi:MAG TPA: MFS transporter [Acidimicrobiales bacterium]|nr:MFS transporter [Acidimicrobiales bacterium]
MHESLRTTFRSLQIRNYRLYFFGQLVSLSGTWAQTVAQAWLVLRLSHNNAEAVGLVTAMQYVPVLLFGAWAGLVADRVDKRHLLVGTQTAMALTATGLAVVTFTGTATIWNVCVLALLTGAANAIDMPARQAMVNEMVGAGEVVNAVGLNSAVFNASRVTGPALAGAILVTLGTGWCFALNAISFVAVIAALLAMRTEEMRPAQRVPRARGQIREGFRYILATPTLLSNLVVVAVVSALALNYPVVLPTLAKVTFHGDAGTYSIMSAAMGFGALAGALVVASRHRPTDRFMALGGVAFGAGACLAAVAPSLTVLVVLLVLVGAFSIVFLSTSNTLLQLEAIPEMRGRVLAVRAITVVGSAPIGAPIFGLLVQHSGARWGLAAGGLATLGATTWYVGYLRRRNLLGPSVTTPEAAAFADPY